MSDFYLQLCRKVRIPNITTVHGTMPLMVRKTSGNISEWERSEKQARFFYPLLRTMELFYSKYIQYYIAVSNITKKLIISDLGVEPYKIKRIYNGIDTKLFQMPSKSEKEKRRWENAFFVFTYSKSWILSR